MQNAEILNQINEFENLNLNDEFELENSFFEGFTPQTLRPQIAESIDEGIWMNPSILPEINWVPCDELIFIEEYKKLIKKATKEKLLKEEENELKEAFNSEFNLALKIGLSLNEFEDIINSNKEIAKIILRNLPYNEKADEFIKHLFNLKMTSLTLEIVEFIIIERNISKQMIEIFISKTLESMRKEDDSKIKTRFSEVIISGINSKKIESALEDISIWNKLKAFCVMNALNPSADKLSQIIENRKPKK